MTDTSPTAPSGEDTTAIESPIMDYLLELREQFADIDTGKVADYIPEGSSFFRSLTFSIWS